MPERQTMNVSLPPAQERFVRDQVRSGRYASASEVLRDGLRLLEEATHKRLVEKWLTQDLTEDELAQLPAELVERVQNHFQCLVAEGVRSGEEQGWVDGDTAMKRITDRLRARLENEP